MTSDELMNFKAAIQSLKAEFTRDIWRGTSVPRDMTVLLETIDGFNDRLYGLETLLSTYRLSAF